MKMLHTRHPQRPRRPRIGGRHQRHPARRIALASWSDQGAARWQDCGWHRVFAQSRLRGHTPWSNFFFVSAWHDRDKDADRRTTLQRLSCVIVRACVTAAMDCVVALYDQRIGEVVMAVACVARLILCNEAEMGRWPDGNGVLLTAKRIQW